MANKVLRVWNEAENLSKTHNTKSFFKNKASYKHSAFYQMSPVVHLVQHYGHRYG